MQFKLKSTCPLGRRIASDDDTGKVFLFFQIAVNPADHVTHVPATFNFSFWDT